VHQPGRHIDKAHNAIDPHMAKILDITPDQIGFAVSVQVTHGNDLPDQRDRRRDEEALFHARAVHQPRGDVTGLLVPPHQIGHAIAIDVARRWARHPDPPDLVPVNLGEPEVPVGAGRDSPRAAVRGNGNLGDDTGWADPPDALLIAIAEPEVAVWAG